MKMCKAINKTPPSRGNQCKFRASIGDYCLAHYFKEREKMEIKNE